jgi:hypothetical protein
MKKIILTFIVSIIAFSQNNIDDPVIILNKGKLWHSISMAKSGPLGFANWQKNGVVWDWPGFDATLIAQDLGGAASHMAGGGFFIGCMKRNPITKQVDSALVVEDWAMYAPSISNQPSAKYIVKEHKLYDNWNGKITKNAGDIFVKTVWEYNLGYSTQWYPERQLPVRVTRVAHQWANSIRDENYIIFTYTIKNISNEFTDEQKNQRKIVDTLFNTYVMLSYSVHSNSRSWNVLFPNATSPGAQNTKYDFSTAKSDFFNNTNPRNLLYAWSVDYKDLGNNTTQTGTAFGPAPNMGLQYYNASGQLQSGEWLAPAYAGFRVLDCSPFKGSTLRNQINAFGWSSVDQIVDLAGPMTGISDEQMKYDVLKDPTKAYNYQPKTSVQMGGRKMWSIVSLGPWDIAPGDSITFAIAEIVDGVDYDKVTGPNKIALDKFSVINQLSKAIYERSADKAKQTFDNGLDNPNPPVAPSFQVDYYKEKEQFVANQITWGIETENIPDPDDGQLDLAGYRLYRSEYLPTGPWVKIADITKADPLYFNNGKYLYVDSNVQVGKSYYYALTAYDNGRTNWNIKPTAQFEKSTDRSNPTSPNWNSKSVAVPSLESSIFANRTKYPFTATFPPAKNLDNVLVVPNPFILGKSDTQVGKSDEIQFVNVPNPCTIRIYTIRGDLVKTINVSENDGAIKSWFQDTDFGQYVQSGVYIYHLDSKIGKKIGKFAIIR